MPNEETLASPRFKKWVFKEPDSEVVSSLQAALKIHPSLCRLLVLRGIYDFESARLFFRPSLEHLHDPFLMKDMDKAIERIKSAISAGEKIMVYGDYDVDGTTAVSLVVTFLRKHYDQVQAYIPDRYKEGYGISSQGIDVAASENVKLIIALDCGIKSIDKVAYANSKGIDFIICDHHLPGEEIPNAVAVLDPKRSDCNYPYKELSGCGIGFKLVQALSLSMNWEMEAVYDLLDLVVVSIAADIVPITGENRVLAYFGMQKVNATPRPGMKALLDLAKTNVNDMDISDLVFVVGPRINAAGRIAHGLGAVELLLEEDPGKAAEKASAIQDNNTQRQTLDKDITVEALQMLEDDKDVLNKKSTVLFQPDWHKGVIGIVASRLIEHYHRPTIVLTSSNGVAVGSGRSVPGFDLHDAIDACSDLLIQFGGHKYAAGLTLEIDKVPAFKERFEQIVSERITPEQLIAHIEVDDVLELDDINESFYKILDQMAPFGPGNMKPVFVTKDVRDAGYTRLVSESHLKLHVKKDRQGSKSGIGFGMWDYIQHIRSKPTFDICYQMFPNVWNGNRNIEIRLKDLH
jgi:single-stranded-DNA-specific exonuclease